MAGFQRRRKPQLKTAGEGKRVIVCFGPPSSGVSTVLDILSRAAQTPTAVVPYMGPQSLSQIEEAMEHVEVVLLDVDGGVFGPNDVQHLVDNRIVYSGTGAMVRLYAPDDDILHRAQSRPEYVCESDLQAWSTAITPVEDAIRAHTLNYFMIPNIELEDAVKQLALRAGILG